jgi:hypothetical protein
MRTRTLIVMVLASCLVSVPSALAKPTPVLGKGGLEGRYGRGWGAPHPKTIFNGGDPAGLVEHIHWRHWGQPTAKGAGLTATFKPQGGYYAHLVRINLQATRLSRCPGSTRPAYTRLIAQAQVRPGGPYGDRFAWALDLCNADAKPAPCGDLDFSAGGGVGQASEITAWDTDCETARSLAADTANAPPPASDPGSVHSASHGFACSGYWLDADGTEPASITWTCLGGTAVVGFRRI